MTATTSEQSRPIPGVVGKEYDISIDTLEKMVDHAVAAMHWGLAGITNEITALHASAWTADDKPVDLRARQTGLNSVTVEIKVGLFGDPRQEQAFHQALAKAIAQRRSQPATQ